MSAEEQVIGYEEDAGETHDEEKEDQEEEDVIPNIEIDDDNGDGCGLNNAYDIMTMKSECQVLHTVDT